MAFVLIASAIVMAAAPVGATTVVDVTPSNTQGWAPANVQSGGTVGTVYAGGAPHGFAALRLTTTDNTASKAQYRRSVPGIALGDMEGLSYWTKQLGGPAVASATLQLEVQLTGSGTVSNLVFEPYWQNGAGNPAPVVPNTWQQWTGLENTGLFWSTRTLTVGACDLVNGAGGPPLYSLAHVVTNCPNARVVGIATNVGTSNLNYEILVDGISYNGTTYNFELNPVYQPSAVILSPAARGQKTITNGSIVLRADYDHDSEDVPGLDWSVVAGDCDTGGLVAGNIGGFTDPYIWDGERFRSTLDVSTWPSGPYCFVFDTHEGPGQHDVRETRTFTVQN